MSGHRNPTQTILAVSLGRELLALVDEARPPLNETRAAFVRESIADRLKKLGYNVPVEILRAPDRVKPKPSKEVPRLPPGELARLEREEQREREKKTPAAPKKKKAV